MITSRQAAMNISSLLALATELQHRPQGQAADQHDRPQAEGRRRQGQQVLQAERPVAAAEDRQGDQDRRHGQVLEQQHREGRPAALGVQPRRSASTGTAMAVDDRVRAAPIARAATGLLAQQHGPAAQRQGAADHLHRAQAEDQLAHQPQPLPRQLQPDHEQQEHHPELGQLGDFVGVVDGDVVQPRREGEWRPRPNGPRITPASRSRGWG
jgi:hypothetical protein